MPRRTVRRATARDIPVLARQRLGMFRDMRPLPDAEAAAVERGTAAWLRRALPTGECVAFLAVEDRVPVAGGALLVRRMMPRPGRPRGFLEAYCLSVFTCEPHRRRGHARAVMRALLDHCRRRRFGRVTLHASAKGKPLYLGLGFRVVEEMRLDLAPVPRRRKAVGARR